MSDSESSPPRRVQLIVAALLVLGAALCFAPSGARCGIFVVLFVVAVALFAVAQRRKEQEDLGIRRRPDSMPPPAPHTTTAPPRDPRDSGLRPHRWPLEAPYRLSVVELAAPGERADPGKRTPALVRIQLTRILIVPAGDSGSWEPPAVIHAGDIEKIELTNASAVLVCRTAAYAFVPASYADRERLEWELAVRFPEAVERGLPGQ